MGARNAAWNRHLAQSLPLEEVRVARVAHHPERRAQARPPEAGDNRELRAYAQPGADRLLRAQRLLLGAQRLDTVRAAVSRPPRGAARDPLLRGARPPGRSRLSHPPVRAWRASCRVRLRLELQLLPAHILPAGPRDLRVPPARRPVPRLSRVILTLTCPPAPTPTGRTWHARSSWPNGARARLG